MNQYGVELFSVLGFLFLLGCFFKSNTYHQLRGVDVTIPTVPEVSDSKPDDVGDNDPTSTPRKPFSECHIARRTHLNDFDKVTAQHDGPTISNIANKTVNIIGGVV